MSSRSTLSLDDARVCIKFVQSALNDGYPLKNSPGKPSAVSEGYKRFCKEQKSNLGERAFVYRLVSAKRLHGLAPVPPINPKPIPPEALRSTIAAPQIGGTPLHAKIIQLQDEVTRLTRELRLSHRNSNDNDLVRQVIGRINNADRQPPPWLCDMTRVRGKASPEVPMVGWFDWHGGEVVEPTEVHHFNKYNSDIWEERCHRLFEKNILLPKQFHTGNYPGIVVCQGGDMVSGGIHPELAKTDDLEVIPASLKAIELSITGLEMMKGAFGKVYCPWVCGNHGRQTAKPEFKRYNKKNFDYLIGKIVQKHFQDDKQVQVDIRDSNDVHFRVFGLRFLLQHGDMMGVRGGDGIIGAIGPIMRGEVKKAGQSAALGLEYDITIMGHWHQPLMLPRAIVCNTLKGFDEYARLQLGAKPTRPSQFLVYVHPSHGITARWEIYVDEKPPTVGLDKWLSVFSNEGMTAK